MEVLLAITTGILYASGIYMILRRSLVKLIIGIVILGNGVNLLIFLMGGLTEGSPALIADSGEILEGIYADPVPQALILTAIVISFGLQSFAIVLIKRAYKVLGTDDTDNLNKTDSII
ncbi:MAG: Na+/H+ antiporter subunit C [Brumimicrobium sp.]